MKINKLLAVLSEYKNRFGGGDDIYLKEDFIGQTSLFVVIPDKIRDEIIDYFNANPIELGYTMESDIINILESKKLIETTNFLNFLKENKLSDMLDITCALIEFIRKGKELSIPIRLENVQEINKNTRVMILSQHDMEEWMSSKEDPKEF